MSVMTCNSAATKRLLSALGVPQDAVSTEIRITDGEQVTVTCEFYPDEPVISEDGELETVLKEYDLIERDDIDGL